LAGREKARGDGIGVGGGRWATGARAGAAATRLVRGDLDEVARVLSLLPRGGDPFAVDNPAARLDALAALGDRSGVEEEAAPIS
jgi:hypothetical protein